jgi:hypothetical protein
VSHLAMFVIEESFPLSSCLSGEVFGSISSL